MTILGWENGEPFQNVLYKGVFILSYCEYIPL